MSLAQLHLASPAAPLLDVDAPLFRRRFARRPFLIRHRLVGHPLFALDRIIELSRRLPPAYVEYYDGNAPRSIDWKRTPRNGLSVEETIRRIEERCSWMVLKRVEQDPEYAALLDRCLDELQPLAEPIDRGMHDRAGAIFVSSPGAITPYHMDREHNFLVQLRGEKGFHVFPGDDRQVVSELELEDHVTHDSADRNLVYDERYGAKDMLFLLSAGYALHVPPFAPHWVENRAGVSISFSLGFVTHETTRKVSIHVFNDRLRRMGLTPRGYGRSPLGDALKLGWLQAVQRARRGWARLTGTRLAAPAA
jgi:hypothetical protein